MSNFLHREVRPNPYRGAVLGLQDGPAASPVSGHLNRLGAHVFYGAALGLGLWALDQVMPETD